MPRAAKEDLKVKARAIFKLLRKQYPDARCALNFRNPLELLVATILSAQCTDVKVNEVTKALFCRYRSAADYANAASGELERAIRPTGFYRNKARSIRLAAQVLCEKHKGKVPAKMAELAELPGVGRKTANVVLGNAFAVPGLPVDTHVTRVANRLGLTKEQDAVKIELELNALIAKRDWIQFSHTLIFHGRSLCKARKALCGECPVAQLCQFGRKVLG